MKKILFILFLSIFGLNAFSQVTCNYNKVQTGNTVTFNLPIFPLIYVIDSVRWDYGDGVIVTQVAGSLTNSVTHTYTTSGTYVACLTVWLTPLGGTQINCTSCQTIVIGAVPIPCVASFIYAQSGNTVSFTSTSSGPGVITSHQWNFGDASPLGTSPNPIHTYVLPGTYIVCHTISGAVTGGTGNFTCTLCDTLIILPSAGPCIVTPAYNHTITGLNVAFSNLTMCTGCASLSYVWKFGDATLNSSLSSPTHTYATPGSYNVCLIANGVDSNGGTCKDSVCKSIVVSGSSGIQDLNHQAFTLYPNPGTSSMVMQMPSSAEVIEIVLTDLTGRKVKSIVPAFNLDHQQLIDINGLNKGIYFMSVQIGESIFTQKLIKN